VERRRISGLVSNPHEDPVITLQELLDCVEGDDFREECQSICACLRELDSRYDWVGIYWLKGDTLVLGPWSGPEETEHKKIPVSEGICGAESDVIVTLKSERNDAAMANIFKRSLVKKSVSCYMFELDYQGVTFRCFRNGRIVFRGLKNRKQLNKLLAALLL
jgi:hypothetical protein